MPKVVTITKLDDPVCGVLYWEIQCLFAQGVQLEAFRVKGIPNANTDELEVYIAKCKANLVEYKTKARFVQNNPFDRVFRVEVTDATKELFLLGTFV